MGRLLNAVVQLVQTTMHLTYMYLALAKAFEWQSQFVLELLPWPFSQQSCVARK